MTGKLNFLNPIKSQVIYSVAITTIKVFTNQNKNPTIEKKRFSGKITPAIYSIKLSKICKPIDATERLIPTKKTLVP